AFVPLRYFAQDISSSYKGLLETIGLQMHEAFVPLRYFAQSSGSYLAGLKSTFSEMELNQNNTGIPLLSEHSSDNSREEYLSLQEDTNSNNDSREESSDTK
ncbi:MAG: hypothetical protein L0154_30870, partial [Chloroflexi bacterium]|nr:hypothetical protein [Chloroflexota bacterium]